MNYRADWNLDSIPEAKLLSAAARRLASKRTDYSANTGRPVIRRPCPDCGLEFAAREMRTHRPECPARGAR